MAPSLVFRGASWCRRKYVIQRTDQCTNFAMVNAKADDISPVAISYLTIAVSRDAKLPPTSATSAFVAR